jgi:hypothetical protein
MIQMGGSLKTWAYFTHTPLSRWKVLGYAIAPWFACWIALFLACLAQVPFSNSTRFLYEDPGDARANIQYLRSNLEVGINDASLGDIGLGRAGLRDAQDPGEMSGRLSFLLKKFYNVSADRQELMSLRPNPSSTALVDGKDPQRTAWLLAIQDHFQPQFRWALFRHRTYDSLIALLLSCLAALGMCAVQAKRLWTWLGGALMFAIYLGQADPTVRTRLFAIMDALPALTIPVLLGLIALALHGTYLAFREWTPVARREPLRLRIR